MKNLIRKILKEDDWGWTENVPSLGEDGHFGITFCDINVLEEDKLTEVMKKVEEAFGKISPAGFGSGRIYRIISENYREDHSTGDGGIVLYIRPSSPYLKSLGEYGCDVGWDTCEENSLDSEYNTDPFSPDGEIKRYYKQVLTHQEFLK
jgi:hypothetical protein